MGGSSGNGPGGLSGGNTMGTTLGTGPFSGGAGVPVGQPGNMSPNGLQGMPGQFDPQAGFSNGSQPGQGVAPMMAGFGPAGSPYGQPGTISGQTQGFTSNPSMGSQYGQPNQGYYQQPAYSAWQGGAPQGQQQPSMVPSLIQQAQGFGQGQQTNPFAGVQGGVPFGLNGRPIGQ